MMYEYKKVKNKNLLNESGELVFRSYVMDNKHFEDSKIERTLSSIYNVIIIIRSIFKVIDCVVIRPPVVSAYSFVI